MVTSSLPSLHHDGEVVPETLASQTCTDSKASNNHLMDGLVPEAPVEQPPAKLEAETSEDFLAKLADQLIALQEILVAGHACTLEMVSRQEQKRISEIAEPRAAACNTQAHHCYASAKEAPVFSESPPPLLLGQQSPNSKIDECLVLTAPQPPPLPGQPPEPPVTDTLPLGSLDFERSIFLCSDYTEPKHPTGGFEMLKTWQFVRTASCSLDQSSGALPGGQTDSDTLWDSAQICSVDYCFKQSTHCDGLVLQPNSLRRSYWDFLCLLLVFYDVITIPMVFFDTPETGFSTFMAWLTRLFWSGDIPLSFISGFLLPTGANEMRLSRIAKRYITTWFFLDVVVVGIDWIELVILEPDGARASNVANTVRVARVLRVLRLLRLLRMQTIITSMSERVRSEKAEVIASIFKIIMSILMLTHLCACFWYGVGRINDDPDNWISRRLQTEEELTLVYRYATSAHWALSQLAGGMDEVQPVNVWERNFACVTLLFGFICAAWIVSVLTSSLTRLYIISGLQIAESSALRRFLLEHNVSERLRLRIQRNARFVMQEAARHVPEDKVPLLKQVSEPLRVELHYELFSPWLQAHPFFFEYGDKCMPGMRKVCHHAVALKVLSEGDVIFSCGERPARPEMFFICTGSCDYNFHGRSVDVGIGSWVSEPALWTKWVHRGTLRCSTDCRILTLDAKAFQDIAQEFQIFDFNPARYADDLIKLLNSEVDPSDLPLSTLDKKREKTERRLITMAHLSRKRKTTAA